MTGKPTLQGRKEEGPDALKLSLDRRQLTTRNMSTGKEVAEFAPGAAANKKKAPKEQPAKLKTSKGTSKSVQS
jgi:hypothetical protein